MSLTVVRAALSVIAEHQAFIERAAAAFPPAADADEANLAAFINLRLFSVRFDDYTNWDGRLVRGRKTSFTAWESSRIRNALRVVASQHERAADVADAATVAATSVAAAQTATADARAARDIASAARRLIRQHRLAWLFRLDQVAGTNPQRLLHPAETDALRLAVYIAGEEAAVAETQLEEDFNVTASGPAA
ncbi:hypothetical protein ACWGJ9_11885 [Curtobacterium citreum]